MQKFTTVVVVAVVLVALLVEAKPKPEETDKVRERAQANYRAVVNELNERFEGYLENCFPRPKGCLCTIGYDENGRELTERRKNDNDCKRPKSADGA